MATLLYRVYYRIYRAVKVSGKPLWEGWASREAALAARWARAAHRRLFRIQWGIPPFPEHADHHLDLYYSWLDSRNPMWLERGVFGGLALRGGDVLELACGDGFNARNFYSVRSRRVVACDFDPKAIRTAKAKNPAPNVEFVLADIRTAMPPGRFDNVIWDAAIEHFTLEEIAAILRGIKERLTPEGIMTGYTLVARGPGVKHLEHHEHEFQSKVDLLACLRPHFRHVLVFETLSPDRRNLYFYASDREVPFSPTWASAVRT